MPTARQLRFSYDDYLAALGDSELKLEYCEGVIYAMAGGTLVHAELGLAVGSVLRRALPGCSVFSSDAKVRVEASDFADFPDVSVVCGQRQTSRIDANALVNPILLVEVTSRSTVDYDRGEKLLHYQRLPSVKAVLFISHQERRITVVERSGPHWVTRDARAGERVILTDPACDFAVDEVYGGVVLEP